MARVVCSKNGPYLVTEGVALLRREALGRGDLTEVLPRRETYALCRCGRSRMQPFCDYKHMAAKFNGTETASRREAAVAPASFSAPPSIEFGGEPRNPATGPLMLRGDIAVVAADGTVFETAARKALCRCGLSDDKPFCDGSHGGKAEPSCHDVAGG